MVAVMLAMPSFVYAQTPTDGSALTKEVLEKKFVELLSKWSKSQITMKRILKKQNYDQAFLQRMWENLKDFNGTEICI
jgi:hypothetical protein